MITVDEVKGYLSKVIDPELGINIVDLGLIYALECDDEANVRVEMTLTTPGCPLHDSIIGGVKTILASVPAIRNVQVDVVWSPPWTPERMSDLAKSVLGGR